MKSYTLNITRNGQTEALFLEEGAAAVVQAEPDTLYLVLDSTGEAVANPLMQWVENDLWVFLDGVQDESPDLVLKDYRLNFPIENSRYLNDTGSTFATAADEASLARISAGLAEEVGISGWTTGAQLWAAAAVAGAAVAGIAAASGGSDKENGNGKQQENSDKHPADKQNPENQDDTAAPVRQNNTEPTPPAEPKDKQDPENQDNTPNPERQDDTEATPPPKPEITLNPMGENNVINAASIEPEQGLVLSGRLNIDAGWAAPAVSVTVGGKLYSAEISGDTWRLKLDGNALAGLQGEQKIAITVTAQDAEGHPYTHTVEQTYTINTQITAPVIEINPVAQDDIINLVESQAASITVTGRVAHAQNGDEIVLRVGEAQYRGTVADGAFSVAVDTKTLVNHGRISAEVTTRDIAANSATGTAVREYRVDTEYSPKISLNTVAGDNVLNLAESKNKVTVSGQVTDVADGEDVVVSCGCESCGSVKWIDILAKVRNGAFSVDFSGETLKQEGYNLIKAKVSSQDDAGNTATAETTQRYRTDLEAPEVSLTIDPITDDNLFSKEEQKAAENYTVSGRISGLKAGERIEGLSVYVDGKSYAAEVTGDTYTAVVPTASLAAATEVRVSANVTDEAGNQSTAEAARTYTVGTTKPLIHLDPIAEDNIISKAEADAGNVTLSGRVENVADGLSVTLSAGNENVQAVVSDGRFSVSVPTAFFGIKNNVQEASGVLSAAVSHAAGEQPVVATQSYSIDLVNKTGITIDWITSDNVLDADEMANSTVTISGKVNDGKVGATVNITVGKATYTATVQEDGRYSVEAEIANIIPKGNNGKYSVNASVERIDQAGNQGNGTASTSRMFTVDKTPPQGQIVFDKVAGDGVINQSEAAQTTITLTGKVAGLSEGDEAKSVTVTVGGQAYQANLTGSVFRVAVPANVLAANTSVSAQGMLKDSAGRNTPVAESTATYELKTTLPTLSVTVDSINDNNAINAAHLPQKVSLKGSLTLGETAVGDTVNVSVEIGGVAYQAAVTEGKWSLDLPATTLAREEGRLNVNVRASVADAYGNTALATAEKEYIVDTRSPEPTIVLNAIGTDDAVAADASGNITVSGKVDGEFKANDTVTLTINGQKKQASVSNTGEFSVEVAAAELTGAAVPVIRAALTTSDDAGNANTVHTSRGYSVKQGDIHIKLDAITSDDVINVTEAGKEIKISGSISGAKAAQGKAVELTIGNEKLNVQVQQDLTFSTTVQGKKLLENSGYTVFARIAGDDAAATATAARSYGVDGAAAARIDINHIAGDFGLDVSQTEANTRIRGVIELEGVFAQGMNSERLRQVTVEIGDKTYKAGVKSDRSFFLDIPTAELAALNGQKLNISVEADPRLYELRKWAEHSYGVRHFDTKPVQIKDVVFDSPYIQKDSDGKHMVSGVSERTVSISGTVSGTAKEGDEVSLEVGGKVYGVKVGDNKTFTAQVSAHDLAADSDHAVKAVLHTTDLSGKSVAVSDVEQYASVKQVSSAFVNAHERAYHERINNDHTSEGYNFPYFIQKAGYLRGGSYGIPFGGENGKPAVIKYHFMTLDEIAALPENFNNYIERASMTTYSSELQDIVREAYKEISSVANIRFEEVGSRAEANTNYFMGSLINGFAGSSAFAYNGGLIAWNSRHNYMGWGKGFLKYTALHEITHTFGMVHTSDGFTGDYAKEENIEFSNMSYRAYVNNGTFLDRGQLRPYDLAYMQYAFGPNQNTRTGNDIYTFKNYNMYSRDGDRYIWDAGGVDTFDASEEKQGVNVNLTPGSWIYVGEKREKTFSVTERKEYDMRTYFGLSESDNLGGRGGEKVTLNTYTEGQAFIGYGTQIENLIGSAHDDILTGNKAANNIYGGAGRDTLNGGEGDDYLDGGAGADRLNGGTGNDTYMVDDQGDVVTEHENQGEDHVFSSIDYTLGNHLEHLTLIGTTAITGQGNEGNNTITGNGANNKLNGMAGDDRIIGGAGSDELTGGEGRDVFVFDTALDGSVDTITDFKVGEDMIELKASIFESLTTNTMAEWEQYVKYHKDTGHLTYDKDGSGKGDAIHFATLSKDLEIDHTSFQVV